MSEFTVHMLLSAFLAAICTVISVGLGFGAFSPWLLWAILTAVLALIGWLVIYSDGTGSGWDWD